MKGIKAFIVTAALTVAALSAHAAVLQINSSGILTGATGVNVGGALYDVTFVDGTCVGVFGVCDVAHFDFSSKPVAVAAAEALLDQVFINQFDTNTGLTYGCVPSLFCDVMTPYLVSDPNTVMSAAAFNGNEVDYFDEVLGENTLFIGADTSQSNVRVWAVWSAAPEPGTLALLGLGLAGLASVRRRTK